MATNTRNSRESKVTAPEGGEMESEVNMAVRTALEGNLRSRRWAPEGWSEDWGCGGVSVLCQGATSKWRTQEPRFIRAGILPWLQSHRWQRDFLFFLLCGFHRSPVCGLGPCISFDSWCSSPLPFQHLVSTGHSEHHGVCLLIPTSTLRSVRRICPNGSPEWQFYYELVLINPDQMQGTSSGWQVLAPAVNQTWS